MGELRQVGADELAALLDQATVCAGCSSLTAWGKPEELRPYAAAVLDPDDRAHRGDPVTGRLLCGLDGNRWTWLIATRATQLDTGPAA